MKFILFALLIYAIYRLFFQQNKRIPSPPEKKSLRDREDDEEFVDYEEVD